MRRPLVSILVPVYNEARTLSRVIHSLQRLRLHKEILVIDDGSTDGSGQLLSQLTAPAVRVLRHARNRGKGAAVRTGLAAARGRFTLIQDADLETDPIDIPRLLRPLVRPSPPPGAAKTPAMPGERAVFGTRFPSSDVSRYRTRGQTRHAPPRLTLLINQLLTRTTNALFGSRLTDMACAYKAMNTHLLRSLRLKAQRFELEAEITARLLLRGIPIVEVPVRYRPRTYRQGKKIHPLDGLRILLTLVKLRLNARAIPCAKGKKLR